MTETAETATVTWPLLVKPNFSKRIMGRESAEIWRVLISAVEMGRRERRTRRERGRRIRAMVVIFGGGGGSSGGGEEEGPGLGDLDCG